MRAIILRRISLSGAAVAGLLGAALVASPILLCGCGSPVAGAAGAATRSAAHASNAHEITAVSVKNYGSVLANSKGYTLYVLTKGNKAVSCASKACTSVWPPLLLSKGTHPKAGKGVKGKLSTVSRGNKVQVTYNGWPLYGFVLDKGARQTKGEGTHTFGGRWYLAKASSRSHDSTPLKHASASSSTTTTTSSGGYGY
ncbi:MAG: COG4315 family predicted lipoprotein [Acidimicrobiales bacterium]